MGPRTRRLDDVARRCATALAVLALAALAGVRADGGKPIPIFPAHDDGDPHERMEKLFWKVERNLVAIDDLLQSADDGAGPARLDAILGDSAGRSREVVDDIDRILELAQHAHPSGAT